MKMKSIILGIVIVFVLILTITVIVIIGGKIRKRNKKIENIYHLRFSYSTGNYMNGSISYELECKEEKCVFYFKDDGVDEKERVEYPISKETILKIEKYFNEIHLGEWDGFQKSDSLVMDGDSFNFYVWYGDKNSIHASGYASWPKHYGEVKGFLISTFGECMEEK